jgi:two-component SAPR family response regulator
VGDIPLCVLPVTATLELLILFQLEIIENLSLSQESVIDLLENVLEIASQLQTQFIPSLSKFFLEQVNFNVYSFSQKKAIY